MLFYFGTAQESANDIQEKLRLPHIVLLDQIHGIGGLVITEDNKNIQVKSQQGDFLVTNVPHVGLGVLTADCLPIVLYDARNNAVGMAHTGWRGAVNNIAAEVIHSMQKNYGTCSADLSIVFGPCAHVCCYQVQEDFLSHLAQFACGEQAIIERNGNLFFDQLFFNEQILLSLGVRKNALATQQSQCTICNHNYFSYRRQGIQAGRQVSIVSIT